VLRRHPGNALKGFGQSKARAIPHRFRNPLNTFLGTHQQFHTLLNAHFSHIVHRRIAQKLFEALVKGNDPTGTVMALEGNRLAQMVKGLNTVHLPVGQ
jgi:hypothetical protein